MLTGNCPGRAPQADSAAQTSQDFYFWLSVATRLSPTETSNPLRAFPSRAEYDQAFVGVTRESRTAESARVLTRSGNHTGESHGTGIKNNTSGSLSERGHRTVAQSAA